ncbi:MAG: transcriptional repressor [Chloroflexi bacterium]|nr:transcriptional repressor [Chloroflexota bacterium]
MQTKQYLRQQLNEHGLRATPQRLIVLQILEQAERHLDAETISQIANIHDPYISLATVYRTLNKLKDVDLVSQLYFARDHKREYYEKVDKAEHYHFTCLTCGKVIEMQTKRINQAKDELAGEHGVAFSHTCMCFEGYCPDCAPKRSDLIHTITSQHTLNHEH